MLGPSFPYGTLTVNVLGSLALGFLARAWMDHDAFSPTLRNALTVGLLGGFTTFSSFANDTLALIERGEPVLAVGNATFNVLLCLGAAALGAWAARLTTL